MKPRGGRRIAILTAVVVLVAVIAAAIALRESILEEWHAYRLPSLAGDEASALAERLARGGRRGRRAAEDWLIQRLGAGDPSKRKEVELLADLGSIRAIPGVLGVLASMARRGGSGTVNQDPFAWYALGAIQRKDLPACMGALSAALRAGGDEAFWAAEFCASIGPLAERATAALVEAMESGDHRLRGIAARALFEIGVPKERYLSALIETLRVASDDDASTPVEAAIRMGKEAAPAAPVLVERLRTAPEFDPAGIGSALAAIGREAVGPLIEMLRDSDPKVRRKAATALEALGEEAAPAVPVLLETLRAESDRDVRKRVILALGRIGAPAGSAVPALVRLLDDAKVRLHVVMALGRIGISPETAAEAKTAVPILKEISAARTSPVEQIHAAALLALIEPAERPSVVSRLILELNSADTLLPSNAAEALGHLGPAAKDAIPALMKIALDHSERDLRRTAAIALGRIGPEAANPLLRALSGEDEEKRLRAAQALAQLGPGARVAVPALIAALGSDEGKLRAAAAKALGSIGPEARDAIPALEAGLKNRFRSFRKECAEALEKIRTSP